MTSLFAIKYSATKTVTCDVHCAAKSFSAFSSFCTLKDNQLTPGLLINFSCEKVPLLGHHILLASNPAGKKKKKRKHLNLLSPCNCPCKSRVKTMTVRCVININSSYTWFKIYQWNLQYAWICKTSHTPGIMLSNGSTITRRSSTVLSPLSKQKNLVLSPTEPYINIIWVLTLTHLLY